MAAPEVGPTVWAAEVLMTATLNGEIISENNKNKILFLVLRGLFSMKMHGPDSHLRDWSTLYFTFLITLTKW